VARTHAGVRRRRRLTTTPTSRSGQQQYDALGDAGGLGLALDLDDVLEGELLAGGEVGDVADGDGVADAGADPDRVRKADLVHAVVELRARGLLGEDLAAQPRDE